MADFQPRAGGNARQVNIAGDNYAPIFVDGRLPLPTTTHQLPPDIPDFTGRADLVAQLEKARRKLIINLYGPPGIGKSALAVHVAHRVSIYRETELYFDFSTAPDPEPHAALAQFVAALTPDEFNPAHPINELRARYLTSTRNGPCLILLDNVREAAQVRPLIPSNAWSVVIITSRSPLTTLAGAHLQRVELLDEAESIALLDTVAGRSSGSEPAAAALAAVCGRLPLAIRVAGAIARKRSYLSYERLAESLQDERTRLSSLAEADLDVRSAFELSYQALTNSAQLAFRRAGLSLTPEFSLADLAALLDDDKAAVAMAAYELADAQLAETADGIWFRYHDLIALFAREKAKADDPSDTTDAWERLVDHILNEFVTGYRAAVGSTRRLAQTRWFEGFASVDPANTRDVHYVPQRLLHGDVPASWQEQLHPKARMLVFGGPGAGKTTLAERICFELATENADRLALSVPMRHYRDQDDIVDLVTSSIGQRFNLRLPRQVLETLFKRYRTVLVLDSLDELPRPSRARAVAAIERFCADYPSIAVLVTSRPDEKLQRNGIAAFTAFQVAPFTDDEIQEFSQAWLAGADARGMTAFAPAASSPPWAANPLLLSWGLTHFLRYGRMFESELDLHEATFDLTVGERDRRRGITRASLPRRELVRSTMFLAAWMKSDADRTAGVTRSRLLAALEEQIESYFHPQLLDELNSTVNAIYESGVASDGEPLYAVVQDTFGEYLAARWVVEDARDDEDLARRVAGMMAVGRFDAGWHYVLELTERRGRPRTDLLLQLRQAADVIPDPVDKARVIEMMSGVRGGIGGSATNS
ncbi:NACHT domain-containing protein [Amycolatopsis sp. MtRt-6]|uniref:NACHT domain-containing protein n=1 Tax=Amycolatopsis sp. MtRt-6 TaxID=2792782 RepID=UPI001A8FE5D1|nr:NACHT domain-containing protein [Amycolatopsis sp. MtRt-6]